MSDIPYDPARYPGIAERDLLAMTDQYVRDAFGVWPGTLTDAQLRAGKEAMRRAIFGPPRTQIDENVVEITVPCDKRVAEEMLTAGMRINGTIKLLEPQQMGDRYIMYFEHEKGTP